MALDSITLYHLLNELRPELIGTRIDRIVQPEKEEIHLILRSKKRSLLRLLLNAGSTSARIHFTDEHKKNPTTAPMFCMILRKHLESGKILDIQQEGLERIVTIYVENYNDRGDLQYYYLHLEIMGKHSNLILVDPQTNTILDGLRRYSHLLSRYREVLPGRQYLAPPNQNKSDLVTDEENWMTLFLHHKLDTKVSDALVEIINGISPELAKELILRAGLDQDTILDNCGEIDFSRLYQAYSSFILERKNALLDPCVYFQSDLKRDIPSAFSFIPYLQYSDLSEQKVSTLNGAVSLYYTKKINSNITEAKRGSLRKVVQSLYSHLNKKLGIHENTISKSEKGLRYQKLGELLTANLYMLSPGMSEITVDDYTDPEYKPMSISLDPALSGIDNAQRYYKLYNKSKVTIQKTQPLLHAAQEEMEYLQSLALSIEQAETNEELAEIHQELIDQGYISSKPANKSSYSKSISSKKKTSQKKKEPDSESFPHVYLSQAGKTIIVGRNNRQNDKMTWREAKPSDMWLHVKKIPGSHVIVPLEENEEFPDDATLLDAAALAVYFSQARGSSQVSVDYTHVKQIKKPKGAKPGMVVYEQNWSLLITPKEEDINRLLATEAVESKPIV
ncbi:MAG: RNA-binding protein [Gracilibacter sp. BRH_c7a]|nr:MAG: RNA-binding protein [Gracilibacter sp. BRH_c7a]